MTNTVIGMQLNEVVSRLQTYAPLSLAATWDNVGLLVEPSAPLQVSNLLLTNDLTQEVMEEALKVKANMIIAYHPPIFQPIKRLTQKTWKERLIVMCMENRIAVYSPHTTYDALCYGINDWLIAPFGITSVEFLKECNKCRCFTIESILSTAQSQWSKPEYCLCTSREP